MRYHQILSCRGSFRDSVMKDFLTKFHNPNKWNEVVKAPNSRTEDFIIPTEISRMKSSK